MPPAKEVELWSENLCHLWYAPVFTVSMDFGLLLFRVSLTTHFVVSANSHDVCTSFPE